MMQLIEDIIGHLGAAHTQCNPNDDKIIVGHIRDALIAAQTLRRRINESEAELEAEGWEP